MSTKNQGVGALKKHKVGLLSVVAMLYCACAAGAFGIEEMITESGPGLSILMLVFFPFVWSVPICLGVAELGSVLPGEGGPFVWIKEAFGEFWSFMSTFLFGISFYVGNAIFVVLSVGYLSYIVELTVLQEALIKLFFVIIFTVINLMGVKEVGKVSVVLTALVLLAFALVAVVGFANWNQNPMEPMIPQGSGVMEGIGGCAAICVWMYTGSGGRNGKSAADTKSNDYLFAAGHADLCAANAGRLGVCGKLGKLDNGRSDGRSRLFHRSDRKYRTVHGFILLRGCDCVKPGHLQQPDRIGVEGILRIVGCQSFLQIYEQGIKEQRCALRKYSCIFSCDNLIAQV